MSDSIIPHDSQPHSQEEINEFLKNSSYADLMKLAHLSLSGRLYFDEVVPDWMSRELIDSRSTADKYALYAFSLGSLVSKVKKEKLSPDRIEGFKTKISEVFINDPPNSQGLKSYMIEGLFLNKSFVHTQVMHLEAIGAMMFPERFGELYSLPNLK